MKCLASELAVVGKPLDDSELVWYALHGLGSHYNNLCTVVNANHVNTFSDLLSQVQALDRPHKTEDVSFSSSPNVARHGNPRPPRAPDRQRQDDRPW
jgi:hypothetical protein